MQATNETIQTYMMFAEAYRATGYVEVALIINEICDICSGYKRVIIILPGYVEVRNILSGSLIQTRSYNIGFTQYMGAFLSTIQIAPFCRFLA